MLHVTASSDLPLQSLFVMQPAAPSIRRAGLVGVDRHHAEAGERPHGCVPRRLNDVVRAEQRLADPEALDRPLVGSGGEESARPFQRGPVRQQPVLLPADQPQHAVGGFPNVAPPEPPPAPVLALPPDDRRPALPPAATFPPPKGWN